jgi:hypothetical protein
LKEIKLEVEILINNQLNFFKLYKLSEELKLKVL